MKNIKKWIVLLFILIFVLSFTACDSSSGDKQPNEVNGKEGGEFFESSENSVYGKITAITGNEIEIAVAKMPEDNVDFDDLNNGEAIIPGENDMPVIGGEEIEDNAGKVEYTGEKFSFTIPAGMKIYNNGQEIALSGLKKGDVISVGLDPENKEKVLSVNKV